MLTNLLIVLFGLISKPSTQRSSKKSRLIASNSTRGGRPRKSTAVSTAESPRVHLCPSSEPRRSGRVRVPREIVDYGYEEPRQSKRRKTALLVTPRTLSCSKPKWNLIHPQRNDARNGFNSVSYIRGTFIDRNCSSPTYLQVVLPPRNNTCYFCGALLFDGEGQSVTNGSFFNISTNEWNTVPYAFISSFCCFYGRVVWDIIQPPIFFQKLLRKEIPESDVFYKNPRGYQSALSICCSGGQYKLNHPGLFLSGPHYHTLPGLQIHNDSTIRAGQIYWVDSLNIANTFRTVSANKDGNLDLDVMQTLYEQLIEHNNLCRVFKLKRAIFETNVVHQFSKAPPKNNLAVLYLGPPGYENRTAHLIKRDNTTMNIKTYDPLYTPARFTLLMPTGAEGWKPKKPLRPIQYRPTKNAQADHTNDCFLTSAVNVAATAVATAALIAILSSDENEETEDNIQLVEPINHTRERCISLERYWKFQLQHREGITNPFLLAGRLSQELFIDARVQIIEQALSFERRRFEETQLRSGQRSDLKKGLKDAGRDSTGKDFGSPSFFPLGKNFEGSNTWKWWQLQKNVAMLRSLGKPTLLVTITCNPTWKEVIDNLPSGFKA